MINAIKKLFDKFFIFFGYKITSLKNSHQIVDVDNLDTFLITKPQSIIFDVGANFGQSVKKFKKNFTEPVIHCFEPISDCLDVIKKDFPNDKSLILNNVGVGAKKGDLKFYINYKKSTSSFKKLIPNTTWIKRRAKFRNIHPDKFLAKTQTTKIITLDDYALENNILNIDLLKIDTQGFEDQVLLGSTNLLKENRIKVIRLELIFSKIYEDSPQIYDIEKILIPNNYKLFSIQRGGSLISDYIFQTDLVYVCKHVYENFYLKSNYFNN